MNRPLQKGTRVSYAHSSARKPRLRPTGVAGLAHSGAFGGSGAPSLRLLIPLVLAIAAFLALTASSAFAARGHEFAFEFGEPGSGPGQLSEPSAVAINEATGEVYVLDQGNARVERFDGQTGAYLGQFSGGATYEDEGTVVTVPVGEQPPTGPLSYNSEVQVSGIAVDNACALHEPSLTGSTTPTCATFDPSAEDVYVLDGVHEVIDKFGADGHYIGQITEAAGEGLVKANGVAVDSGGGLRLFQKGGSGVLDSFDNAVANSFSKAVAVEEAAARAFVAPGLALDGEGAFYLRSRENGQQYFAEKFDPQGHRAIERLDLEVASGIAADQRTDGSFVDNLDTIAAFSPTGTELERLPVPGGHGAGLAVDAAAETLYAVDSQADAVYVYTPQQPGPPSVGAESVSDVSGDSATLEGEVNPRGAATSYRFEYGPCAGTPATCAASPYPDTAPVPDGLLGADFGIHAVAVHLQGLAPHTIYHFRLGARNEAGGTPNEVHGEQQVFVTQPPGGGLILPDGRGWELVSPPDKLGALIEPIKIGVIQAAASGDAITYLANAPIEAQPQGAYPGGAQILSTRIATGWGSLELSVPHEGTTGAIDGPGREYSFFSEDLALGFVQPYGAFDRAISAQASEQTAFLHTNYLGGDPNNPCLPAMGCYRPLVTGKEPFRNVPAGTVFGGVGVEESPNVPPGTNCPTAVVCGPEFVDATPDGSHAIVRSLVALTGTPIAGETLYEWNAEAPPASQLQLVSVLPEGGAPAIEPQLGLNNHSTQGAFSGDGSKVVFEAVENDEKGGPRALYLRAVTKGQTIELDTAEAGCDECESGGGRFQLASADGSRVLFTDSKRLTGDAGGGYGASEGDLYECRIVEAAGHVTCDLTDLTPEVGGVRAGVLGALPGVSADAGWVYFVANGALTTLPDSQGEQARPGNCESGTPGATCNLYLLHDGRLRLVSVLSGADVRDWNTDPTGRPARVSPNGQWLALMSQRPLTGYDNRDALTGHPDAEVYLYSAAADRLVCASCEPSGARPTGIEYHKLEPGSGGIAGGPQRVWEEKAPIAAIVPGWTGNAELGAVSRHQPRYLGDQGRLFFNSFDGLVPQDENGTVDVYQYEPGGVGDCTSALPTYSERSGGCVSLLSSGASAQESAFLDASESGEDVFFLTASRLTARDVDGAYDVYDARVGGGETAIVKPVECSGDACQQPAVPPNDATPGSLTFQGAGNLLQCPKGKVKKNGKCVKQHKAKKHHKKHGKKNKRARANHGGKK